MTPHIVRTEADADAVRQIEASRMHWCLGDVIDITGDVDLRGRKDDWPDAETHVVYPDMKPEGEVIPAPQGRLGAAGADSRREPLAVAARAAPGPPASRTAAGVGARRAAAGRPADRRVTASGFGVRRFITAFSSGRR